MISFNDLTLVILFGNFLLLLTVDLLIPIRTFRQVTGDINWQTRYYRADEKTRNEMVDKNITFRKSKRDMIDAPPEPHSGTLLIKVRMYQI